MPAFNEANLIGKVIDTLPRRLNSFPVDILVVDDGSKDQTAEIARAKKTTVLQHVINRGLGAVLGTAFRYAVKHNYDYVVTFDADGQHRTSDLPNLIRPLIEDKADIVIGSRMLKSSSMPNIRQAVNRLSNILTFLMFKIWTTDSQSGLRAFTGETLAKIQIRSERMEVSSEIFKEISRLHLRLVEVPIDAIYTKYSLAKGQHISNAPHVFWKLLINILS